MASSAYTWGRSSDTMPIPHFCKEDEGCRYGTKVKDAIGQMQEKTVLTINVI